MAAATTIGTSSSALPNDWLTSPRRFTILDTHRPFPFSVAHSLTLAPLPNKIFAAFAPFAAFADPAIAKLGILQRSWFLEPMRVSSALPLLAFGLAGVVCAV